MEKHRTQDAEGAAATSTQEDGAGPVLPANDQVSREREAGARPEKAPAPARGAAKKVRNNVRKMRTERMMSKAELARRAGMSTLTIDRVERGFPCRMDTKRKILEALGLKATDRVAVFGEDEE